MHLVGNLVHCSLWKWVLSASIDVLSSNSVAIKHMWFFFENKVLKSSQQYRKQLLRTANISSHTHALCSSFGVEDPLHSVHTDAPGLETVPDGHG